MEDKLSLEDLRRLAIEVPRYTSYPTAAEFSPRLDAALHAKNLANAARETGAPVSLYVHLPFCKELCAFCGCHALVARTSDRIAHYLSALGKEMTLVATALGGDRPVAELHFGGGSPSFLEAESFEQLMARLRATFPFAPHAALSLEADPRTVTLDKLRRYRAQGITRVSFGFQDLDDQVQYAIGRHQSADVSVQAFDWARSVGFDGINVDLCYGLPRQTEDTFARTVAETIRLRPDRVALFGYAHVPWLKPLQKRIAAETLPATDLRLRLVADAHARLRDAGYVSIGFDHFALPTDDLARAAQDPRKTRLHRNFQGYTTTCTDTLVGLGLSAISELPDGYAQNLRTLSAYYAAIDAGHLPVERGALRSAEDRMRGDIIRRVLCEFRLDFRMIEQTYHLRFADTFAFEMAAFTRLADDGLLTLDDKGIELSHLGRLFARNVAVVFDAYRSSHPKTVRVDATAAPSPPERRFSSSI